MKRLLLALVGVLTASPALATGGFVCRTAGANPVEVAVGFGHVPGSPLILTRLTENRRQVPVQSAQWWLDNREMRLVLISPDAMRQELVLRARRSGHVYDGSAVRNGRNHWVRCGED